MKPFLYKILFAYFSILIMNFGDYSRYVKSSQELLKGNLSLIISTIIYSFLLLVIVIGADIFFKSSLISTQNLLTNPTDIVGKINNTYITVTVLIFIFFASSSTNLIANYFPSQNILLKQNAAQDALNLADQNVWELNVANTPKANTVELALIKKPKS